MRAIVIVANGWHTGWLGCYGNEWLRTHNLDRLAAESIVFDQHFAVDPSPAEWYRSVATGRYSTQFNTVYASLIRELKESGVRTVRILDLKHKVAALDIDWYQSIDVDNEGGTTPGEAMFQQLDQILLELVATEDWLLWIETDRFVPPWDVSLDFFDEYAPDMAFREEREEPQPWDEPPLGPQTVCDRDFERLQTTFASVVTEWDVELAEWFNLFREHHLDRTALWMITAGYGLSLGEHGWIGPSATRPFEELGHLPLIVRLPNAEQAGRRVPHLTASIDILPTVQDAFSQASPTSINGRSLLPAMRGKRSPIHSFIRQRLESGAAIRTEDWALLTAAEQPPLLFRKPEDRWEVNNLRQQHLLWAEHLESRLAQHLANPDTPLALEPYDDIMNETVTENNNGDRASGE